MSGNPDAMPQTAETDQTTTFSLRIPKLGEISLGFTRKKPDTEQVAKVTAEVVRRAKAQHDYTQAHAASTQTHMGPWPIRPEFYRAAVSTIEDKRQIWPESEAENTAKQADLSDMK